MRQRQPGAAKNLSGATKNPSGRCEEPVGKKEEADFQGRARIRGAAGSNRRARGRAEAAAGVARRSRVLQEAGAQTIQRARVERELTESSNSRARTMGDTRRDREATPRQSTSRQASLPWQALPQRLLISSIISHCSSVTGCTESRAMRTSGIVANRLSALISASVTGRFSALPAASSTTTRLSLVFRIRIRRLRHGGRADNRLLLSRVVEEHAVALFHLAQVALRHRVPDAGPHRGLDRRRIASTNNSQVLP